MMTQGTLIIPLELLGNYLRSSLWQQRFKWNELDITEETCRRLIVAHIDDKLNCCMEWATSSNYFNEVLEELDLSHAPVSPLAGHDDVTGSPAENLHDEVTLWMDRNVDKLLADHIPDRTNDMLSIHKTKRDLYIYRDGDYRIAAYERMKADGVLPEGY